MSQHLYFVALLPDLPLSDHIKELKKDIFLEYGEAHALQAPAHVLIMPPFTFEEERVHQLQEVLQNIAATYRPFSIVLHGFRFFEPRVMFLHILQNRSLRYLEQIVWDKLTSSFPAVEWKQRMRFHPHISLVSRIRDVATFFRIQKDYVDKPYHASFPVHELVILRWEEHKKWEVAQRIPLKGVL